MKNFIKKLTHKEEQTEIVTENTEIRFMGGRVTDDGMIELMYETNHGVYCDRVSVPVAKFIISQLTGCVTRANLVKEKK